MGMRHIAIMAAGLTLLAGAAEPEVIVTADTLGWMSGDWEELRGDRWTEEHWSSGRGGALIGTGRSGRGDALRSFEYMRIAPGEGGVLHFFGSPGGAPAVAFQLVHSGPAEAVFENPKHDYPQRVRYWRDGQTLMAETSDITGGKAMRWAYQRKPATQ